LNSRLPACKTGTLLHESYFQFLILKFLIQAWFIVNSLTTF
jgi:hypothetical protein